MNNKVKQRNSSIELYRILAMLFVVAVHYNGWLVGGMPQHFNLSTISIPTVSQATIQGFTSVCVNCFLVITGFYGLKFKGKTFWNIWLVLVSIYVPCYLFMCVYQGEFHPKALLDCLIAITRENYYAQCYLMLVFLSPILNTFINKYGKQILPYVIGFWLIEFVFDILRNNQTLGFAHGYGLIHFVFMYLLGRCAYFYKDYILAISAKKLWGGGMWHAVYL